MILIADNSSLKHVCCYAYGSEDLNHIKVDFVTDMSFLFKNRIGRANITGWKTKQNKSIVSSHKNNSKFEKISRPYFICKLAEDLPL